MSQKPNWPNGPFADWLGSRWPIIQAPMAGAGGVDLAVAAIDGGAVGSLPCALLTSSEAREQIEQVRARADRPLNLNFFCHEMPEQADCAPWENLLRPFYDEFGIDYGASEGPLRRPFDEESCMLVEAVRPEFVSFHFGLPDKRLLERVRASGSRVIATATTVREARWLAERGVDAIIAQGWEAGGHAGRFLGDDPAEQMGLIALLPQVVDAVHVPVIAAGGIADGRGIAAAFMLGASAVQIGTAYLHCPESMITDAHRSALRSPAADGTRFTNLFTGGLARGIVTRPMEELGAVRAEAPAFPLATAALAPLAKAAAARGEAGFRPMWSGQAALLGRPVPARDLTERLGREALALLGQVE